MKSTLKLLLLGAAAAVLLSGCVGWGAHHWDGDSHGPGHGYHRGGDPSQPCDGSGQQQRRRDCTRY